MQRERNLATTRPNCAQHSPKHFLSDNLFKHLEQYELWTPTVSVLQVRELGLPVNKLQSWHLDSAILPTDSLHSASATDIVGWGEVKLASLFPCLSATVWSPQCSELSQSPYIGLLRSPSGRFVQRISGGKVKVCGTWLSV